jgi:hypothetical protein
MAGLWTRSEEAIHPRRRSWIRRASRRGVAQDEQPLTQTPDLMETISAAERQGVAKLMDPGAVDLDDTERRLELTVAVHRELDALDDLHERMVIDRRWQEAENRRLAVLRWLRVCRHAAYTLVSVAVALALMAILVHATFSGHLDELDLLRMLR